MKSKHRANTPEQEVIGPWLTVPRIASCRFLPPWVAHRTRLTG